MYVVGFCLPSRGPTLTLTTLRRTIGARPVLHGVSLRFHPVSGVGALDPMTLGYPDGLDTSLNPANTSRARFEGMKAYRQEDGTVRLFRPDKNMARMNRSAQRIALPVRGACRVACPPSLRHLLVLLLRLSTYPTIRLSDCPTIRPRSGRADSALDFQRRRADRADQEARGARQRVDPQREGILAVHP